MRQPDCPPAPPPYTEQFTAKETRVRQLLAAFDITEWRDGLSSPDLWYYRNKMEYAFAAFDGLVLGMREAGRFDRVFDMETCLLMSPETQEVLNRTRQWAKQHGLSGYHRRRHEGDLRYLVMREGKNTGQRMGILIAHTALQEKWKSPHLINSLKEVLAPLLTTCWIGFTAALGDVARAEDMHLLWGSGTLEERLGLLRFQISPFSFFQTNTHGAERLYELLHQWGKDQSGALLDLYCGSGGIALSLATCFDRVVGVDTNKEAISNATENAVYNNLHNTEFVATDVEEFLKKLPASKLSVQLSNVVVDPPRPGLHPKAMKQLLDLNPAQLAYVSCNPESLARDLQQLVPFYKIRTAQIVDMFPHTPHVETVVTLEHR